MVSVMCLSFGGMAVCAAEKADTDDWKQRIGPEGEAWRKTEQHLILNNNSEPATLDPHTMTGSPEIRLARALFEGLTTLHPETLAPAPGVAREWKVADGFRKFTFRLRKEARWSDGKTLRAADFVRSWKRALTPATENAYAGLYYPIEGAEAFFKGMIDDFAKVGVRAVDDLTLEVRLRHPCTYFLELTAFPTFYPVRTDLTEAHGARWTQPEHIVVNGPFVPVEWDPRRSVVVRKNERYWDADYVKLGRITFLPLDDLNTAYQLFLKGKAHWLTGVPQARVEEIQRHPDYYVTPFFGTYFYRFNTTRPPYDDARVRKALCLATDRREITEHILKAGQLPVGSLCPPVGGYDPVDGLSYDRDAARRLMADAGYGPKGKTFPPIEILYNTSEAHKVIAEAIAQQWKRNLGLTVSARNVEWKIFLSDMEALKYDVARSSWIGDYGAPSTFFDCFRGGDGNNRTGWKHARYDRLAQEAAAETDPARRLKRFREMETILVEQECPIMPIYRYVNQGMLSPRVRGWFPNIRDIHNFKYIWMQED